MGLRKRAQKLKSRLEQKNAELSNIKSKVTVVTEGDLSEFEGSNQLVVDSKKEKKKLLPEKAKKVKRRLTKKQRKELEKVIERKKKKEKRGQVLEELTKLQASKKELSMMIGTQDVYSRKYLKAASSRNVDSKEGDNDGEGQGRKRKLEVSEDEDESSSSEDEQSDDESSEDEQMESAPVGEECTPTAQAVVGEVKKTRTILIPKVESSGPAIHIPVNRDENIQTARLKLPILDEEQPIMELIYYNPIVIICGETGSGKTTQLPQFLYESGYAHGSGIIGVTEPRRVAASSMASRVATEMNLTKKEVSYQIRYEGTVSKDTRILFMTDGVLLKEVQNDFLLTRYSVIVLDEAHERSVFTDILIGLLSRIVPLREKRGNPLKLVIMSATLRVEDFTKNEQLFKVTPPVINISARQFPVTVHFNKETKDDYLAEAYKKVCKVHRKLPFGGILVFVTGQQEVHQLVAKLRKTFPASSGTQSKSDTDSKGKGVKRKRHGRKFDSKPEEKPQIVLPEINLDSYAVMPLDEEAELDYKDEDSERDSDSDSDQSSDDEDDAPTEGTVHQSMHVLPLFSLLSSEQQAKVFQPPPEGTRLCIVATNVAETSLTIPNVKYVVDTGKTKTKFYDKVTGVSTFKVTWVSQASAAQRAGRAGRTSAGHCYRLYSSAVYQDFDMFSPPEITRRPCDDLVLQMKNMNIDKVVNFPFPTRPSYEALASAETLLTNLGALKLPAEIQQKKKYKSDSDPSLQCSQITKLGRTIAKFPISPRFGKMLNVAHKLGVLPYMITVVASLSVQELFEQNYGPTVKDEDAQQAVQKQDVKMLRDICRKWAGKGHSLLLGDLMVYLKAIGACEYSDDISVFCRKYGLREKAVREVRKLRAQLINTVNLVYPDSELTMNTRLAPPTEEIARTLRKVILSGMVDHVARKMPKCTSNDPAAKKLKNAYQTTLFNEPAFIHQSSVLIGNTDAEYIVFQRVEETKKIYMKDITVVSGEWLMEFARCNCVLSEPLDIPEPRFDEQQGKVMCHVNATYGPHTWPLHSVSVPHPPGLEAYRWFVRAFLDGSVCPLLKQYTKTLLSAPNIMHKSWARLQPRTEAMLQAVASRKVLSKPELFVQWAKDEKYLLDAYLEWIPEALHQKVTENWPPI